MIRSLPVRRFSARLPVHGVRTEPPENKHEAQPEAVYVRGDALAAGPHSLDEIKQAIARGKISVANQAWHKGWYGWSPLSAILDGVNGEGSPAPSAEDGVEQFYERVASSFRKAAGDLLESLTNNLGALGGEDSQERWDDALLSSLGRAGTFHARCAEALATTVRYFTPLDAVRRTPTRPLSDEIRREGFGAADKIVRTFAVEVTTGETIPRAQRLQEYLAALSQQPSPLVNCVAAKCYGASTDTEHREACIRSCTAHCNEAVKTMLRLIESHPSRRASVAAAIASQEYKARLRTRRYIRLAVSIVLTIVIAALQTWGKTWSNGEIVGFSICMMPITYMIIASFGF